MLKTLLLLVQVAGILLSATLVLVTFADRSQVEQRVQDLAIAKVEAATSIELERVTGGMKDGGRAEKFRALTERLGAAADRVVAKREVVVRELVREVLWDKCRGGCNFPKVVEFADEIALAKIKELRLDERSSQEFIVERYESSVRGLISDLRRFGLVNLVVLSLMMALVLYRRRLSPQFFAFSAALTGYTAWAAYGYVYNQNWALTLLLQDWAAPGYQAAMVFVNLVLLDWLFLEGRITDAFLSSITNCFRS